MYFSVVAPSPAPKSISVEPLAKYVMFRSRLIWSVENTNMEPLRNNLSKNEPSQSGERSMELLIQLYCVETDNFFRESNLTVRAFD